MHDWQEQYAKRRYTCESAVGLIRSGEHIFVGSGAAAPHGLLAALAGRAEEFENCPISHILTLGDAPHVSEELARNFRHNAWFIGANVRSAVRAGRADYTPVFLSQVPGLVRSGRLPVDVALIQTTEPNSRGSVNLGVSVDVVLTAVERARLVIAEFNPNMPRVHGDGELPMSAVHAWVPLTSELPELARDEPDEAAREIGRHVAGLVGDGATLQVGIGQIPDAVLAALGNKRDLGIWTEMLTDGVVELVERGVVTGRQKTMDPGRVSASFAIGSAKLYRALDDCSTYVFHGSDVINDPLNIARQHRMVAINTALQVDLTGQVCSDSIGSQFYSGIGGQVDFIRGASMCPGGIPIIALPSTAVHGTISRIVATLYPGAGVVTSRGDVHYVVTEYGVADLHARSIHERATALISIAHPQFRSELTDMAQRQGYVPRR